MQEMQDTIRKIIEIDKEARRLTDEARARRAGSAKAVEQKKHEASEGYLTLARQRIGIIRAAEEQDAADRWAELEKQNAEVARKLEEAYSAGREKWVSSIVSRVTSGDDLV